MVKKRSTRGKALGEALRGGLANFFADMRKEGKTTADIWRELFEDDAATAMRLAISLAPKEVELDQNISGEVSVNTNQIADEVYRHMVREEREKRDAKELH